MMKGHAAKGDGIMDPILKLRYDQVFHVSKLFKYPRETLRLVLPSTLKKTVDCSPPNGHDYIQMTALYKNKQHQ